MSDVLAWTALLLPLLIAALLAVRLLLVRRSEAELGWKLAAQKAAQAEATERSIRSVHAAELARTLHDDLGHRLTLAAVETAALQVRADTELAPEIDRLRESISQCVEALNRSVSNLSQDSGRTRLKSAVEAIASDLGRTGTSVRVSVELLEDSNLLNDATDSDAVDDDALPASVTAMLLSVVREGCTNALRHAPGSSIDVRVKDDEDVLVVDVENNAADGSGGNGLGLQGTQHGLRGLTAQLETLGGSLEAGPTADGWRIRAQCPRHPVFDIDEARSVLIRRRRRTRQLLIAVPVAVAVLMLAIPAVAVFGQAALSRLPTSEFETIEAGQGEDSVRQKLPVVEMESPPPQKRAGDCVHYESTISPFDRTDVYEVCFSDGLVSSTTTIPAP